MGVGICVVGMGGVCGSVGGWVGECVCVHLDVFLPILLTLSCITHLFRYKYLSG